MLILEIPRFGQDSLTPRVPSTTDQNMCALGVLIYVTRYVLPAITIHGLLSKFKYLFLRLFARNRSPLTYPREKYNDCLVQGVTDTNVPPRTLISDCGIPNIPVSEWQIRCAGTYPFVIAGKVWAAVARAFAGFAEVGAVVRTSH